MKLSKFRRAFGLASSIACCWIGSLGLAADVVQPLRIARASVAESQVDEGSMPEETNWVLLHHLGLKVVNVESGAETDVLTVNREDRLVSGHGRHLLTPDGKFFAAIPLGQRFATIRRVADGATMVELDSVELLNRQQWNDGFILASDAAHLLGVVNSSREHSRLVRIDLSPEPRVTASHDLGPLFHRVFATPDSAGIVATVPCDDTAKARSGRWLQIFDHQLRLQHKEKVIGPMTIVAAVDLPNPLIAIRSLAGDNGIRFPGQPHWTFGELVRGSEEGRRPARSQIRTRLAAREWIMTSAAFSPDGKWLVTSRDEALPALTFARRPRASSTGNCTLQGDGTNCRATKLSGAWRFPGPAGTCARPTTPTPICSTSGN